MSTTLVTNTTLTCKLQHISLLHAKSCTSSVLCVVMHPSTSLTADLISFTSCTSCANPSIWLLMASTCDEYFSLSVSCVYMQQKQTVNTEVVLEPESLKGFSQYIKKEGGWYTAPIKMASAHATGLWQCPAMLWKTPRKGWLQSYSRGSYSCFLLRRLWSSSR